MIINPIIPVWVMLFFIPIFCVCLSHEKNKRIRQLVIILLIFLINLRVMVRDNNAEVISNDLDVLFVVDNTISMAAEDYDGDKTRLSAVKEDIKHIVEELEGAKFSIVTFDNAPKILLPYTRDKNIIYESINILQVSTYVFARGTSLNEAIQGMETQLESSSKSDDRARIVFFFSDGEITVEDKVDTREFGALKDYISEGAVLGYGTDEGGHMYVRTDSLGTYQYVKYQGKKAISKIDEKNLGLVSDSLGIDYINMSKHSNLDKKIADIKDGVTYKFDIIDKSSYQDTYYFLMIPLLGLLGYEFINFRRGV